MRCWVGMEREGSSTERTLFVESKELCQPDTILTLAKKYDVQRIYFGAGKVDVVKVTPQFFQNFTQYKVILETSLPNLAPFFDEIVYVLRIDLDTKWKKECILPKFDFEGCVRVFESCTENSSEEVKEGMYKNDVLVWEE